MPLYEPEGGGVYRAQINTTRDKIDFYKDMWDGDTTKCYYWSAQSNHTELYYIDKVYCKAYVSSQGFHTSNQLAVNRLMSCRCVQEVE